MRRTVPLLFALFLPACSATDGDSAHDFAVLADELEAELAARASEPPLEHVPAVRAARRALAEAQATAARAGAPAVMADVEHVGRGADHETELMVALDLALLAGGGRQAAQRAEAQAAVVLAQAELDAARYTAGFELARTLVDVRRVERLQRELAELADVAAPTLQRMELLDQRGWLAQDAVAAARAIDHQLIAQRDQLAAEQVELESALAIAYGRADGATLAALSDSVTAIEPADPSDPTAGATAVAPEWLLEHHPNLQVARADWLAAEAAVRVAAAEQWPALLLGPKAVLASDDWLIGGLARLELPWPSAAAAAVDAARRARDAAREALAGELAAQTARITAATARCEAAWHIEQEHATTVAAARSAQLTAAAARFAADSATLREFAMALEQRMEALLALADARAAAQRATLDYDEARGQALTTATTTTMTEAAR